MRSPNVTIPVTPTSELRANKVLKRCAGLPDLAFFELSPSDCHIDRSSLVVFSPEIAASVSTTSIMMPEVFLLSVEKRRHGKGKTSIRKLILVLYV